MTANLGHNTSPHALDLLANDAKHGLEMVSKGEGQTIEGWIIYGAALNEGRSMFPSDEQFGQWVISSGVYQLGTDEIRREDRAAAMWAAANQTEFEDAKKLSGARTVRGIHAKHLEHQRFQDEIKRSLEPAARYGRNKNEQNNKDEGVIPFEWPTKKRENIVDLKGRDPQEFNRALHYVADFEEAAKELERQRHDQILPTLKDKERQRMRAAINRIDAVTDKIATRI